MAFAAATALDDGAREIDMVIPVGLASTGEWSGVEQHIRAVRRACGHYPLKVILETGYFGVERIQRLSKLAVDCGADFLKTSTGFGPRGASVEDVALLSAVARSAGRPVSVKASGGIRSLEQARALLGAGATRIGTSQGVAIAKEELV
jgi:deoxyribose-phosphate aldolase